LSPSPGLSDNFFQVENHLPIDASTPNHNMFNERVNIHAFNQNGPLFHDNNDRNSLYPATPQSDSPTDQKEMLDLRLQNISRQLDHQMHPEYKQQSHIDDVIASERSESRELATPVQNVGDMKELTHMIAIYN
jgi:hypothetical protein